MKSYHFFLKDLFDTGMYGGACCTYSLRLAIQMGVEGGFCGVRIGAGGECWGVGIRST